MAGYSARQSSFTTGDTITAAHSNNEFNAILAAFHVSTGHTHDGTTAGDGGPLSTLYSNAISMGTGADTDIAVTFNANSNDGVITWMEDEDYFQFSDDILLSTTEKVQFRDTAIYINSSTDGQLDLVADTEIQIAATTVDINGNVDISGTLTIGSAGISEAELEILDGATVTTTELNIIDGDTSATSTTVADADRVVYNDAGTMKQVAVTDLDTYISATSKTLTNKTLTSPVLNTGVSGTAVLDEDDMSSNSATKLATQQSIKAYVDTQITAEDLDVSSDSGTIAIDLDSETLTIAGGTGLDSSATSNTVTLAIDSTVATLTGSQTLTNKTLTSPVLNTGVSGTAVLDEDNMSSDSATKLATQQSIKAYVDSSVSGVSTSWVLEDDDGTEVSVASGKEVKFIGSGLTTNWTDTDNGTDGDPYDLTFTVDAAQTGITSLLATDIKIGEDNETKIDFETANEIHFYANNTEQVYLADNIFGPQSDSDVDLGTTGVRWKDAYIDTITTTGAITVGGDLTVNGTTTTVNSTTITVDDPIFTLGGDSAPGSDDNKDRGIEFRWHNGTAAKVGFFGYDDSESAFTFIPDASNSSEVFSGTVGNVIFGNIAGTLTTAAQTNITSVGTLTALTIDNVIIDGATIGHTSDTDLMTLASGGLTVAGTIEGTTITASTALVPDASGGADLGSTSLEWGDLYIADDKKIYLGSDQNLSIEYDEDGNDTTAVVAAGGVSMAPHGSSAGNGTELRFQELAANGANYVGFKAPDAIASNEVWVLPNADGSADQVLKTDGSNALAWVDQAGGGTVSLVADGAITAGKPTVLTSAGKAAQISGLSEGFATENQFNGSDAINYGSPNLAIIGTNKVAVCYRDAGNSNYAVGRVAEVAANGDLTFGTAVVLNSAESVANVVGYNSSNSTVAFGYTNASTNAWYVKAGTISGTTLSLSSEGTIETSIDITQWSGMVDPDTGHFVIFHTGGGKVYATAVTISGTDTPSKAYGANITGTTTFTNSGNSIGMGMDYDTNQNRFLLTAGKDEPESAVKFWVVANSGSAFTITEVSKAVTNWKGASNVVFDPDNNKMILSYNNTSTQFSMAQLTMASADFTIDHYIHTSISNDAAQYTSYDTDTNKIAAFIGYGGTGATNDDASFATFTNSGTAFTQVTNGTWDTEAFFAQRGGITKKSLASLTDNPIVIIMSDAGNSGYARSFTVGKTNLTSTNFLGIAAEAISDTATGKITIQGGVNENQSSLTVGTDYFSDEQGNVKQKSDFIVTNASPTGNYAVMDDSDTTSVDVSSTYESSSSTYVLAYKDASNSSYGTAVAGTWSSGTVSWGTPVVFESSAIDDQPHICSGGSRVHVTYRASDGAGGIRSASISGTTMTFAAETVFAPNDATYGNPMGYHCVYDTSTDYVILAYSGGTGTPHNFFAQPLHHNTGNGTYTLGAATTLVVNQVQVSQNTDLVFDPDTNRSVVIYTDGNNSNQVTAQVIQSSGTSGSPTVTVGSDSIIDAGDGATVLCACYDTENNKVFVAYNNSTDSNTIKGIIGTVTGSSTNSIAFAGNANIWNPSGTPSNLDIEFDGDNNKALFFYRDEDSGDDLTYKIITLGASSFTVADGAVLSANDGRLNSGAASFGTGKGVLVGIYDTGNSSKVSYATVYYGTEDTFTSADTAFLGRAIAATKIQIEPEKEEFAVGTSASNLVQLNSDTKLPAVDGSLLTNLPAPTDARIFCGSYDFRVDGGSTAENVLISLPSGYTAANVRSYEINVHGIGLKEDGDFLCMLPYSGTSSVYSGSTYNVFSYGLSSGDFQNNTKTQSTAFILNWGNGTSYDLYSANTPSQEKQTYDNASGHGGQLVCRAVYTNSKRNGSLMYDASWRYATGNTDQVRVLSIASADGATTSDYADGFYFYVGNNSQAVQSVDIMEGVISVYAIIG